MKSIIAVIVAVLAVTIASVLGYMHLVPNNVKSDLAFQTGTLGQADLHETDASVAASTEYSGFETYVNPYYRFSFLQPVGFFQSENDSFDKKVFQVAGPQGEGRDYSVSLVVGPLSAIDPEADSEKADLASVAQSFIDVYKKNDPDNFTSADVAPIKGYNGTQGRKITVNYKKVECTNRPCPSDAQITYLFYQEGRFYFMNINYISTAESKKRITELDAIASTFHLMGKYEGFE